MMPYDVPVTQPGSAVHQNTSPARRSRAKVEVAWWATTASCTCTAPLGVPVVPLVKCSSAMSSGSVGGISKTSGAVAITSARSARARLEHGAGPGPDEEDVLEVLEVAADLRDLPAVELGRRDEHPRPAEAEPLVDRVRAEGGEEGREHARVLQGPEQGDVLVLGAAEQRHHPVALADAEVLQDVREPAAGRAELGVGDVGDGALGRDAAQGGPVAVALVDVAVDRLVGDVEPSPVRETGEAGSCLRPGESGAELVVVRYPHR